ncbi:hypothetical protein EJB05_28305, partial [Eragrostis curvula]
MRRGEHDIHLALRLDHHAGVFVVHAGAAIVACLIAYTRVTGNEGTKPARKHGSRLQHEINNNIQK